MAQPTIAEFLVSYPEFAGAPTAFLQAKLNEAWSRTNAAIYQSPTLASSATMLSTAILMLRSPYGLKMRSENPEQMLVWEYELRKAQRAATIGRRVF